MSDFDLDQHVNDMVEGLREKHPRPHLNPVGLARRLIEQKILRVSRDTEQAERIRRAQTPPLRYTEADVEREAAKILLPPGVKRP